jgi:hypothetical protein
MILKDINCRFGQISNENLYKYKLDDIIKIYKDNYISEIALTNNYAIRGDAKKGNSEILTISEDNNMVVPALTLLPPSFRDESYTRNELYDIVNSHQKLVFRIYPKTHKYIFAKWQMDWMFDFFEESKVFVLVAIDEVEIRDLAVVKQTHPGMRIMLTNTTQWMNRIFIQLCKYYDNIYIDTCNIIEYYGIETFCSEIGSDKILFGTNIPAKEPYDNILTLKLAEITIEEKENIAYRNFDRLVTRN